MIKIISIILIIFFKLNSIIGFGNCLNHKKKPIVNLVTWNIRTLKQHLVDSLNLETDFANRTIRDEDSRYVLYLDKINNRQISIIAFTDSISYLLERNQTKWIERDSFKFPTYAHSFAVSDLNGDKNNDLIIYGFPNMHGQSIPYVLLYTNNNFHYRSDIHLYNINYDRSKNLVRSYYQGGVYSINQKEYYRWENDSLKLVEGVEQNCTKDKITVTFYKVESSKRVEYKRVTDNSGEIYDSALWKDEY